MTPPKEKIFKKEYAADLIKIAEGDLNSAKILFKALPSDDSPKMG